MLAYNNSLPVLLKIGFILNKRGKRGLKLAETNIKNLSELCKKNNIKMTIAVYPWPAQILKRDLESIQVKFWKNFAEINEINFINLFPDFIDLQEDPAIAINKYYIQKDNHWNFRGHQVVTNKVYKFIKKDINL